ncbi:hypothetical protein ISF_00810 [Cordyceps fumosorosea ARSEF 2679]|uniref:DUF7587 domain-containing protein n=1 Tax=Cordyceps fumosorosea (strain ARSEF 2679) TaxID=1081104 RepID=A0A162N1C1_CORFA|nr:hypothetical protein ISF_00810 [Cordyceps fumosorosea ARSEF 2679]OAA73909.1 hypothetical protein ISF_00810 [Cordyceps fumosorosea ARSEF 2679]
MQSERESSYPKYLYRAHTYGHPYPRYDDAQTDSFLDRDCVSDYRSWAEYERNLKIGGQFEPESPPTEDVFLELSQHLRKLRIKRNSGGNYYRSRMVSLSGNLCWATHRLCEVWGMAARDGKTPGLAVLDVRKIQERGFHVWRVRDMLRFLRKSGLESSIEILDDARSWANNADEYVCWDFVPGEALVSFTPQPHLRPTNGTARTLLGGNFVNTCNLSAFGQLRKHSVSLNDYVQLVAGFIRTVAPDGLGWEVQIQLLEQLANSFLCPGAWGYHVSASDKELKRRLNAIAYTDG